MTVRRYLQEASTLASSKTKDGTYRVRIITEGEGSTGIYNREMLEKEIETFSNAPSFINHPIDPSAPHLRDAATIAGRIMPDSITYEIDEDGLAALWGEYKPNSQWSTWVEENGDLLGLSIFIGAYGEAQNDGKLLVESLDQFDPYKSVDIVVAAGRGGRFEQALESYRAIESSLGTPVDKTSATSASEKKEGKQVEEKLDKLIALFETFVTEQQTAAQANVQAEADAEAVEQAVTAALDTYDEKIAAIDAVEGLLPSQVEGLKAAARKGEDITVALESATKIVAEFKTVAEASGKTDEDGAPRGRIVEGVRVAEAQTVLPEGW